MDELLGLVVIFLAFSGHWLSYPLGLFLPKLAGRPTPWRAGSSAIAAALILDPVLLSLRIPMAIGIALAALIILAYTDRRVLRYRIVPVVLSHR